jgi:hypothetical protein
VSTLRAAAELLANARGIDSLAPIAVAVGCAAEPVSLDAATRDHLGIDHTVLDVRIAAGGGALRALLVEVNATTVVRDAVPRIATRLASRAPHVLWLLVATSTERHDVAIAAWTGDRARPRVAALIADRRRLVDSDAETMRALIAAAGGQDVLTHARWVEILGRDSLTRRFYHALERAVTGMARSAATGRADDRAEIALLFVSRLLFLAFLEAKGWLDGDHAFLTRRFDDCMAASGGFHQRVALPLFFGTLNTPLRHRAAAARRFGRIPFLNGGLFARTPVERRARGLAFSDEAYGVLLRDLFAQYRFTAREESATWSEAAVDPEMLGKAFESLMVWRERRTSGAFFTPHRLVDRVAGAGLERALARALGDSAAEQVLRGEPIDRDAMDRTRIWLGGLTILDPACGSGAFLVHALEQVAGLLGQLGDARPLDARRRAVLARSIFGVDINPTAVWLCELRLWLSVVIETDQPDVRRVEPLPNLDHNIRVGDALAGRGFADVAFLSRERDAMRTLRQRYANASGARKESLARRLDALERQRALDAVDSELASIASRRRELILLRRGHDLFGDRHVTTRDERAHAHDLRHRAAVLRASRRAMAGGGALPFAFTAHFADVGSRGGFDLIVGNPPWVRLHRVPAAARARFRRDYAVARWAAWEPGAGSAGAGRGFGAQVDVAALFVERAIRLLAPGGALALLIPAKLWRSLAGGGMRRLVTRETELRVLDDYSEAPATFDAAVYPSLLVAERRASGTGDPPIAATVHRAHLSVRWCMKPDRLPFDETPGSPWIVLPPDARRAFDRVRAAGVPLAESALGRPYLGVKCGCNDAFVVHRSSNASDGEDVVAIVDRHGRAGLVERELLRPLVRGEQLGAWRSPSGEELIIWTHDARDQPLHQLPPQAARWFAPWRRQLAARTDARHAARWWSLFRTESARSDRARVAWADIGRVPRATVLVAGDDTVPLNSCYVTRCRTERDAFAFAALLNSPLAAAWLAALSEPARGGYHRYLGWTMALLPIPTDWARACDVLAPVAERARRAGNAPGRSTLLEAALAAYGLDARTVAPLIAWLAP